MACVCVWASSPPRWLHLQTTRGAFIAPFQSSLEETSVLSIVCHSMGPARRFASAHAMSAADVVSSTFLRNHLFAASRIISRRVLLERPPQRRPSADTTTK